VTEYSRIEKPVDAATLAALPKRTMDCVDCHNRPAHATRTPDFAVDRAFAAGVISPVLPFAKALAVESLSKTYPTRDAAHDGLRKDVNAFYAGKYPDVAASRAADVTKLGDALIGIYDDNVFPEMKVTWGTYPSNIGHRSSAGCFRCHDGKHVSPQGKVLVSECSTCHTDPQRGPPTALGEAILVPAQTEQAQKSAKMDMAWHPWQTPQKHLDVAKHKEIQCYECHLNGRKPKTECNECHSH
jgi:hypothetical protein